MASYNVSVTQSIETQPDNVAAGGTMEYVISNPLGVDSYFTLETVPNANGAYDSSSPKNTSGSYTLGSGIRELIKNDYFASVIVSPGGGTLTLVPAVDVTGSTLRLNGVGYTDVTIAPSVDPDAQAFITAAGITDPTQQSAINTLVVNLKAYGLWTKMKAIYPFCGSTATQQKYNLKDPRDLDAAFRLVFNGGGTHASTGWTPNGVNGYGNTFYTPSVSGQLNSAHLSFYSRTTGIDNDFLIGADSSVSGQTCRQYIRIGTGGDALNTNGTSNVAASDGNGFLMNKRENSTEYKSLRNGSVYNTASLASNFRPDVNLYIGCRNSFGTAQNFTNKECAFASIGDGMTDTEAANLYTAVQAYQTTLGRQV